MPDLWMSLKEISLNYGIPHSTLREWCRDEIIPGQFVEIRENQLGKLSRYVNIGKLKEIAEIRVHFIQETGGGLDYEDLDKMSIKFKI